MIYTVSSDVVCGMRSFWHDKFFAQWRADQRQTKEIVHPDGSLAGKAVFSPALLSWYQNPERIARYNAPTCFFCDGHDEYMQLRLVGKLGHLDVYECIKFCEQQHFLIAPSEHREKMTVEDVAVLRQLSVASGLSVFGNFRDAGASYPTHVHYQTLETIFPAVGSNPCKSARMKGFCVEALSYRVLLICVKMLSGGEERSAQLIANLPQPLNVLYWNRAAYIIPRTKSVPSNTAGNKLAAAEVFGTFYCRSLDFYNSLDYGLMSQALSEVCLPAGSDSAREYWDRAIMLAQEV